MYSKPRSEPYKPSGQLVTDAQKRIIQDLLSDNGATYELRDHPLNRVLQNLDFTKSEIKEITKR